MHRICRPAPAPGGCGGRDRAATSVGSMQMSDDNTLPGTGCFSRNASVGRFRGGDDASARKRIAALTIGGTGLLTRYSPLGFRSASERR
jgi:hypothetical protein